MKKKTKFPVVSLFLMVVVYTILGIVLLCLPHAAPVIWGMDIPTFIIMYGAYVFLILACLFHVKTNR